MRKWKMSTTLKIVLCIVCIPFADFFQCNVPSMPCFSIFSPSIPNTILERVSAKYPNFMQTVNELLETNYTFENGEFKLHIEPLSWNVYVFEA